MTTIDPNKVINFLISKNKVIDEAQITELVNKYNSTNDENKKLIDLVFSAVTCYSLEMINKLQLKSSDCNENIIINKEEHKCLLIQIKDLTKEISNLTQEISKLVKEINNLKEINNELRDSYYDLHQKMIKKKDTNDTKNVSKYPTTTLVNDRCPKCGWNYSYYREPSPTKNSNIKYC